MEVKPKLYFKHCTDSKDLRDVYNYEVDVFAEAGDFLWSLEALEDEINRGWKIYAVRCDESGDEIISVLFVKLKQGDYFTKNTSLKLNFQGKGISHSIKEFFEMMALKTKAKNIVHFCAVDNFRSIALNESHGYLKIDCIKNGEILKWKKAL
jgi:RimJ/RimL family protein N-acetyltransferase